MKTIGMAFLFWVLCFFGLFGLHRIYTGRYITGVIWFFTLGLFLIGQIVDLFLLSGLVNSSNREFERAVRSAVRD